MYVTIADMPTINLQKSLTNTIGHSIYAKMVVILHFVYSELYLR